MGTKITYYIIILPVSILPYPILYLLSDILYFMLYRIIGYRKKVVMTNLKNAFPEKDEKQINKIMSKFYRHFSDLIIESLKAFTISDKQLKKRLIIKNSEIINNYALNDQPIIIVGGHFSNWEIYGQAAPFYSKHKLIAIYKPLSNSFYNSKIIKSRERFSLNMMPMKKIRDCFRPNEIPQAVIFVADQSPSTPRKAYWLKFLNQDTGVHLGVEKFSKLYNFPVFVYSVHRLKRGYYEAEYKLITDNPEKMSYGDITEAFTKAIEEDIIEQPQYWLWSHDRWKHKRPINI